MTLSPLALPLVALALQAGGAPDEDPRVRIEYTDAPIAGLWEALDPALAPAELPASPWPGWEREADDPWDADEPWAAWAALVRAEAAADEPDPTRRAQLCRLALLQGRHVDAWRHFAAAAADPATLVALAPAFFPGVPFDHPVDAHGLPAPLPDGATLSPALPPPRDGNDEAAKALGDLVVPSFRVGEATLAMRLTHQPDGIQIDVDHVAGPPASVTVRFPVVPQRDVERVYVDWEEQATVEREHTLRLSREDPEHSVWGRFRPDPPRWPRTVPDALPVATREGGVRIELAAGDEEDEGRAAWLARAATELLGVPFALADGADEAAATWAAPRVRVGPGRGTLAELVSRVERFALRR